MKSLSKNLIKKPILKRHAILLEVLISLMLVIVCIIPFLFPHAYMLIEEKRAIRYIELDRAVNLIFAEKYQNLYNNDIPWEELNTPIFQSLNDHPLIAPLNFGGRYLLSDIPDKRKQKVENDGQSSGISFHLIDFKLEFFPFDKAKTFDEAKSKNQLMLYHFQLFVERHFPIGNEGIGNK